MDFKHLHDVIRELAAIKGYFLFCDDSEQETVNVQSLLWQHLVVFFFASVFVHGTDFSTLSFNADPIVLNRP